MILYHIYLLFYNVRYGCRFGRAAHLSSTVLRKMNGRFSFVCPNPEKNDYMQEFIINRALYNADSYKACIKASFITGQFYQLLLSNTRKLLAALAEAAS
jgi:hypothetical protein